MIDVMAGAGAADPFRGSAVTVAAGAFLCEVHFDFRLGSRKDAFPIRFFWLIHFHLPR
jgi:hypothetical protein